MKTLFEQNQAGSPKPIKAKNTQKGYFVKPLIIKGEMLVLSSEDGLFL